jgi:hypothetical protein
MPGVFNMITKTRSGVFETNSSSTHSICIDRKSKNGFMDTSLVPDENGVVHLQGGEFGWSYERFHDAQSKASYVAIYLDVWVNDLLQKEKMKNEFVELIKTQTGATEVSFDFSADYDSESSLDKNWSYIDHQSVEDRDLDYLWDDLEDLRQFIFNPNSVLITDNDNH